MFAIIYEGCACKDGTWHVTPVWESWGEDDGEEFLYCDICHHVVLKQKTNADGYPCFHALTDDEIFWEMEARNDDDREGDGYDDEDY